MNIQTQYNYEKVWSDTQEKDLLRIIEEEIGDADPKATLEYVKDAIKNGKIITVGSCKFKIKGKINVSK
ncbi:MAG: hypothetical protein COB42_05100 [Sulfurimonas sp.]|nr:MAG: hypothetical protein COB42_05100 [Sulfurimonas sp.]